MIGLGDNTETDLDPPVGYRRVEVFDTVYGRMVVSPIDAAAYACLTQNGRSYDDCEIQSAKRYLQSRPSGAVVDVGASFGCWSLALAPVATLVHAFEPQRSVYNMLCGSIVLNGLDHVIMPHLAGLAATPTKATIQRLVTTLPGWSGGLALDHTRSTTFDAALRQRFNCDQPLDVFDDVEVDTLDSFAVDNVRLIKIDAQGMEREIVLGAAHTIKQWHPLIVTEWTKDTRHALLDVLASFDYRVVAEGHDNLICVPRQEQ